MTEQELQALGEDFAADLRTFAVALEAAGLPGPHIKPDGSGLSKALGAVVMAHVRRRQGKELNSVQQVEQLLGSMAGSTTKH